MDSVGSTGSEKLTFARVESEVVFGSSVFNDVEDSLWRLQTWP